MKTLSLKLDDSIFQETERLVKEIKQPRNRYINEALALYNKIQNRKYLAEQFKTESKLVREESLNVLAEFENLLNVD